MIRAILRKGARFLLILLRRPCTKQASCSGIHKHRQENIHTVVTLNMKMAEHKCLCQHKDKGGGCKQDSIMKTSFRLQSIMKTALRQRPLCGLALWACCCAVWPGCVPALKREGRKIHRFGYMYIGQKYRYKRPQGRERPQPESVVAVPHKPMA